IDDFAGDRAGGRALAEGQDRDQREGKNERGARSKSHHSLLNRLPKHAPVAADMRPGGPFDARPAPSRTSARGRYAGPPLRGGSKPDAMQEPDDARADFRT